MHAWLADRDKNVEKWDMVKGGLMRWVEISERGHGQAGRSAGWEWTSQNYIWKSDVNPYTSAPPPFNFHYSSLVLPIIQHRTWKSRELDKNYDISDVVGGTELNKSVPPAMSFVCLLGSLIFLCNIEKLPGYKTMITAHMPSQHKQKIVHF